MSHESIENIVNESLLYDFYGALLTDKQREVMELYHEENLSIIEIADEFGVSKQAVHDTLKKAQKLLDGYEEKLGLVKKLTTTRNVISQAGSQIDRLKEEIENGSVINSSEISAELDKIKTVIAELED